jgi:methionine-rich copper-binding protein CopC
MGARRRLIPRALAAVALLALWSMPAWAHSELVRAEPPAGSTAPPGLREIVLEFNEALGGGSTLTLYAGTFAPVAGIEIDVEGPVLTARLAEFLVAGTYTVEWRVIGEDGHPVQGSYQFAVAEAGTQSPSSLLLWGAALAAGAVALVAGVFVLRRRRG